MIAVIIACLIIQIGIIVLATKYVWNIHGLELIVFLLGVSSLAVLGVLSLAFVNT
jgi:hypothetical protein